MTARLDLSLLLLVALALAGCGDHGGLRIEQPHARTSATGTLERTPAQPSSSTCARIRAGRGHTLGTVAFADDGVLRLFVFAGCRIETLVSGGVAGPIRFSPNGLWIAYGNAARVVPRSGPLRLLRPLGVRLHEGPSAWAWSANSAAIAGVTAAGGVVAATPTGSARRLLPDGWGASALVAGPHGELGLYRGAARERSAELWLLDLGSGRKRRLYRDGAPNASLRLAGFTSDGRGLLFWRNATGSDSIAADGLPLEAVPTRGGSPTVVAPAVLARSDFVADCGGVVVAAGEGRESTFGKRLELVAPARRQSKTLTPSRLSVVSPACSPAGRLIAAAAGPNRHERVFGEEGRSIWLLAPSGRGLRELTEPPPAGTSDESPHWSHDGRFLLFVRSGPVRSNATSRGALYLVPVRAAGYAHRLGPLAQLGPAGDYYGSYNWSELLDWSPG